MKERILAFCLKHWKEIWLVLLLLVVFGKSQYDMRNIIKAHETSEQSLRTQIETLRSLHSEELRIRDEAIERYQRDIEELDERYKDRLDEIEDLTKVEIDVIIEEFNEDKELLAERFVETYGFRYVQ